MDCSVLVAVCAALPTVHGFPVGAPVFLLRHVPSDGWTAVASGEDEVAGEVLPFRILLTLRSSTRRALVKRRVIKGVRLDDDSPDGMPPDACSPPLLFLRHAPLGTLNHLCSSQTPASGLTSPAPLSSPHRSCPMQLPCAQRCSPFLLHPS